MLISDQKIKNDSRRIDLDLDLIITLAYTADLDLDLDLPGVPKKGT